MDRVTQTELGGIRYAWVCLEGRPGVNVGRASIPKEEAIQRAKKYWEAKDREEGLASQLREEHGKQAYIGNLPTHDIAWEGLPGRYVYVLKDRKSGGRYVVLEAIELRRTPNE